MDLTLWMRTGPRDVDLANQIFPSPGLSDWFPGIGPEKLWLDQKYWSCVGRTYARPIRSFSRGLVTWNWPIKAFQALASVIGSGRALEPMPDQSDHFLILCTWPLERKVCYIFLILGEVYVSHAVPQKNPAKLPLKWGPHKEEKSERPLRKTDISQNCWNLWIYFFCFSWTWTSEAHFLKAS